MKWIETVKQEPEVGQIVLGRDDRGVIKECLKSDVRQIGQNAGRPVFRYNYDSKCSSSANCGFYDVLHWTPLPEEP